MAMSATAPYVCDSSVNEDDGQLSVKTTVEEMLAHWKSTDIPLRNFTVHFAEDVIPPRRCKTEPPRFTNEKTEPPCFTHDVGEPQRPIDEIASDSTSDADDHQVSEQHPDTDDEWESDGSITELNASTLGVDGQHQAPTADTQQFCHGTSPSVSAEAMQQVEFCRPLAFKPPLRWAEVDSDTEDEDAGHSASGDGSSLEIIESLVSVQPTGNAPGNAPTGNAPTGNAPICHHVKHLDAQIFDSKNKLVIERSTCGNFIFTVRAPVISHQKGQANFRASNGRGKVEVKFTAPGSLGECTVTVKVGDEPDETIKHNFSPDSNICKIPQEFDFRAASQKKVRLVVSVR